MSFIYPQTRAKYIFLLFISYTVLHTGTLFVTSFQKVWENICVRVTIPGAPFRRFWAEAENINKTNMKCIKKETEEALGKTYEKDDMPQMPYE